MCATLQGKVTEHWNDRAPSYIRNHNRLFNHPTISSRWTRLVAELVGPAENLEILDAGCGPATLTRALVELGHRVTAVDVSGEMLAIARAILGANAEKVKFLQADASDLTLPEDSFDLVVSRNVVWTLPDPARALKEWKRVLKPGGRLGVIDGNWYYHYYRNGLARLWLKMVGLCYRVKNGFDRSQKLATHYAHHLPATHMYRPDWDIGLLAGIGFVDIRVRRDLGAVIYGLSWERLNSVFSRPFLIEARKPSRESGFADRVPEVPFDSKEQGR